ncbi:c-type cytochrome biogenesis protein CcmI [Pseudaminobacter sp. 19-2017]|uniref:C-type cytochrome biogenesis protein CcmI n=1 Tax=Pseudaminobacter soli (ex Zhang et al. 2022) TaxID=2831468 RepID=A0A942E4F1_9HYPH|nr:c-type cytochrome biogenesis protein CcmI [Pseudaminobacter soli]MBS3650786.1 c-type cytochrome biogenesis protein CcmI [Pseudaminobacter soli]
MLFWIIAALLTLAASLAVIVPLASPRRRAVGERDHDIEVYKDQLKELERDAARGLIGAAEAEEARAEIGRRILKIASRDDGTKEALRKRSLVPVIATGAVLAVPLVSWGLYAAIGSPALPAQPLSARLGADPAKSSIEELVARAESHLASNPEDGRGWDVLAPVYLRTGRFADSVAAYRSSIRLEGETPARLSGLGEAIAGAAGGIVTAEARAAFAKAAELDTKDPKARFYLATADAQEGKLEDAATAWRKMLQDLPAESPWRGAARDAIAEAERRIAVARGEAQPGPTQDQIDAAAAMSDTDRAAMINSMVEGLDAKLRQNPQDPEGWIRLVRSYAALGRTDEAKDALGRGLQALDGSSEDGKRLLSLAASLGLALAQ